MSICSYLFIFVNKYASNINSLKLKNVDEKLTELIKNDENQPKITTRTRNSLKKLNVKIQYYCDRRHI